MGKKITGRAKNEDPKEWDKNLQQILEEKNNQTTQERKYSNKKKECTIINKLIFAPHN